MFDGPAPAINVDGEVLADVSGMDDPQAAIDDLPLPPDLERFLVRRSGQA